jgi:hypothetical protein
MKKSSAILTGLAIVVSALFIGYILGRWSVTGTEVKPSALPDASAPGGSEKPSNNPSTQLQPNEVKPSGDGVTGTWMPLVTDSLTRAEEGIATGLALSDPAVRSRLEGHQYAIVGSALFTEKYDTACDAPRACARVGIYDYTTDHLTEVVVDLIQRKVRSVSPPGGPTSSYPLTPVEQARARELALQSPMVAEQLSGRLKAHLASVMHTSYLNNHRAAAVGFLFTQPNGQVNGFVAIVDLSAEKVVEIHWPSGKP